ncbi:MAG: hypothetical protein EOO89_10780 [Pedobacter sp.]|nr:MAG: hypothetical protein EOO89_10780 [Pedobacter sp.]
MKKLTLLLLCVATLGLASCRKETFVDGASANKTFIRDIAPSAWVLSSDGLTYSASLSISDIDPFHIQNEGTLAYISYTPTQNSATSYIQLPFVYNVDAYSFEVYNGGLSIDIQSSDFQSRAPIKPTGTVRVKVVLVPSEYVN